MNREDVVEAWKAVSEAVLIKLKDEAYDYTSVKSLAIALGQSKVSSETIDRVFKDSGVKTGYVMGLIDGYDSLSKPLMLRLRDEGQL